MKNLFKALSLFQKEVGSVSKDAKNPFLKNKYASLDAMINHCSPILTAHGLSVIQLVSNEGVNTMLCHESGESIETGGKLIPVQVSKGLSQAQAEGVSITYTRRYQYSSILGLSTDEDTDGQYNDNKDLKPTLIVPDLSRGLMYEKDLYNLLIHLNKTGKMSTEACNVWFSKWAQFKDFSANFEKLNDKHNGSNKTA